MGDENDRFTNEIVMDSLNESDQAVIDEVMDEVRQIIDEPLPRQPGEFTTKEYALHHHISWKVARRELEERKGMGKLTSRVGPGGVDFYRKADNGYAGQAK